MKSSFQGYIIFFLPSHSLRHSPEPLSSMYLNALAFSYLFLTLIVPNSPPPPTQGITTLHCLIHHQ